VLAQDYINLRNSQAEVGPARNYHDGLLAFAAGKGGR
jgi:hypothetical protein